MEGYLFRSEAALSPTRRMQTASPLPEREGKPSVRRQATHTLSDLLIPFSTALDLAEGRDEGHAQRVAYIAGSLAEALSLEPSLRLASTYAGLFHDVGAIPAGAGLASITRGDERLVFAALPLLSPEDAALEVRSSAPDMIVEHVIDHVVHGARLARDLSLPDEAIKGISCHHERWDGNGYPYGLSGREIPQIGAIVAVADNMESMINQERSPLSARRNIPLWLVGLAGTVAGPEVIAAARSLTAGDDFWLGLYSADLSRYLRERCGGLRESKGSRLMSFAERFSEIMDSRFDFTTGVSARVTRIAEELGKALGLSQARLRQLRVAALLHDVGQLGVPERIMAKPGILSVEELEVLRQHPLDSSKILAGVAGLEEVAEWVSAHHERPDGRGYPEGKTSAEIPLEARILAVADAYVAITSDRPHRSRAEHADGVDRLTRAGGSQLDASLVRLFIERGVA
jgi:HD-GYP domain-containing protein (c-di-GMP phosphodiesterase class II)